MQPWEAPDLKTAVEMLAKKAALTRRMKKADLAGIGNALMDTGNKALEGFKSIHASKPMLTSSLVGAGVGGAIGGLSSLASPRKERRHPFSDALTGALAGGAVGAGGQYLHDNSPMIQEWMGKLRSAGQARKDYSSARGAIPEALDSVLGEGNMPTPREAVTPLFGSRAGDVAAVAYPAAGAVAAADIGRQAYRQMTPTAHSNLRAGAGSWLQDKDTISNTAKLIPDSAVSPQLPEPPLKPRVPLNSSGQPSAAGFADLEKARVARNVHAKEVKDVYDKAKVDHLTQLLTRLQASRGRKMTNTVVDQLGSALPSAERAGVLRQLGEAGQAVPASRMARNSRVIGYGAAGLLPLLTGLLTKPPQSKYLPQSQ